MKFTSALMLASLLYAGSFVYFSSAQADSYSSFIAKSSDQKAEISANIETYSESISSESNKESLQDRTSITVNKKRLVIPVQETATLVIKNTGSQAAAYGVHAVLPETWDEVYQDDTDCSMIPPGKTCTLKFFSTIPYLSESFIRIKGDNLINCPLLSAAFSMNGYLVFDVKPRKRIASVVSDQKLSPSPWGNTETIVGAKSTENGKKNTSLIVNTLNMGNSAAMQCYFNRMGNVPIGTWYLPALCQMSDDCGTKRANIQSNLIQLGFITDYVGYFWSSSERNQKEAKAVLYDLPSFKIHYDKDFRFFEVICAQDISY